MHTNKVGAALIMSLVCVSIVSATTVGFSEAAMQEDQEKAELKALIESKMGDLHDKDLEEKRGQTTYDVGEYGIPYNMVFEKDGTLVVGIDPDKALEFGKGYTEDEIKKDLDTEKDIDVVYYRLEREADIRGGEGIGKTVSKAKATITVIKNQKIVTTGHGMYVGTTMIAGYPDSQCAEVYITKRPTLAPLRADSSYGEERNSSRCNNNFIEDTIRYSNTNYRVSYGTDSDISRLDRIHMSGITTQDSGQILHIDVTTRDVDGVLKGQVLANYRSANGDSGAPVFKITGDSSATLIGQHVGKAHRVDFDGGTNTAHDVSRWNMVVFSPWDQVESTLWG